MLLEPLGSKPSQIGADDAYVGTRTGDVGVSCPNHDKETDRIMWKTILAISLGAAVGALVRWQLGLKLNGMFPSLPPGTLVANLVGGYIIGLAVAFFAQAPNIAPEWRLMIITGFCGGLTTFSTFSAEVVSLLEDKRLVMAMGSIATHVLGSLSMTLAGLGTWQLFKHA